MQISETGLNKGFTLLEIIIVLTIISVASTSFYLLLRQPAPEESLEDRIEYFREISLYTGSIDPVYRLISRKYSILSSRLSSGAGCLNNR